MKLQHDKRQGGFSLIEIAIVLVIIGLMIGGVVKGQTMVKNSKIKRIATDTASVQGAINAYTDSYWQLPGDDNGAATRWGTASAAGNGGGTIAGVFVPATPAADETALLWNHLYCSELAKGTCVAATSTIVQPKNPMGGVTGVADGSFATQLGLLTKVVCMTAIPADYAVIYDNQFDDGVGTTGNIRGSLAGVTTGVGAALAYPTTSEVRSVCTGF